MTIHAVVEYLRYRWKAQNRHGVHSPFAYAFVADIIENRASIAEANMALPWPQKTTERYNELVRRMMTYYGYKSVTTLPVASVENRLFDVVLIGDTDPAGWLQLIAADWVRITNNSAIIIQHIHKTSAHSRAWNDVCKAGYVKMSIDLYGIGLLFFRKEMLVQQRFVLKL